MGRTYIVKMMMIGCIAFCDRYGNVERVVESVPEGFLEKGQNAGSVFAEPKKLACLLEKAGQETVSDSLDLCNTGHESAAVTVKKAGGGLLLLICRLEDPGQEAVWTKWCTQLCEESQLKDLEEYGEGYYEIQKMNNQLVNYQRALAKANAKLKGLLEEARKAKCTIEILERDPLTNLYLENVFYDRAGEVMKANPELDFDIIAMDVKRFKIVNDVFGRAAGDRLLADLALCLLDSQMGEPSLYTRARADMFFALVPREEMVYQILSRNIETLIENYPLSMRLEVKIGVYQAEDRTISIPGMCDRAYLASESIKGVFGRNLAFYDESLREKLLFEQKILNTMEDSLRRGDFHIYLQPKVEISTEKRIGAEVLVRWIHPEFGLISPGDFIPVFERNGFIYSMDLFVWERACELLRSWKDAGRERIPISVNVSRRDIYHEDMVQKLSDMVRKYGISPGELHLEITESAYAADSRQMLDVIGRLRKLGFVIEMDDFGKGYSSLNTLSELPVDVLKMDLEFLRRGENTRQREQIMQFVINLAEEFQMQVIAEGVEKEDQAELLQSMGCRYAQGYFFGRPVPCGEF